MECTELAFYSSNVEPETICLKVAPYISKNVGNLMKIPPEERLSAAADEGLGPVIKSRPSEPELTAPLLARPRAIVTQPYLILRFCLTG